MQRWDRSSCADIAAVGDAFCVGQSGYRVRGKLPLVSDAYLADQQDSEIEGIYGQLEKEFGAVTYEAWLALLVSKYGQSLAKV